MNLSLDAQRAAKLAIVAERTDVQEANRGPLPALECTRRGRPDPRDIASLLDAIPGAWERAQVGLRQSRSGDAVTLDEM